MKKIVVTTAFLLFFFYTIGYYFVYKIMQYRYERITREQLDEGNYDGAEIVILKMPVNLPYQPESPREERVYGKVLISGKWYNKVSRRMVNDNYFIKCVLDRSGQTLTGRLCNFISFILGNVPGHRADLLAKYVLKEFLPLTELAFHQKANCSEAFYSRLMVNLPALLFPDKDTPPPRFL